MPATKKTKKRYGVGGGKDRTIEVALPSIDATSGEHNVCLVRRPGVQGLIAAGVLDSFDSLTALVQMELIDPRETRPGKRSAAAVQKANQEAVASLAGNAEKIQAGLDLVDKVVEWMLVEPKVLRPVQRDELGRPIRVDDREVPLPDADRDDDITYTDEVDLEDRLFLLNFAVGGSSDLERFRAESAGLMGGLAAIEDTPGAA